MSYTTCTLYHRRPVHVRMEEMPIPVSPMEIIGTDFIGPFPVTEFGYRYAITIIDYHAGWAEVFPTRDQSAREIVRVFAEEFLPRHGHPRIVINDNGQGFASKAWADFLQAADIRLVRTTPVHPQGNAKVERFNKTFKDLLNKALLNQPNDWVNRIPRVLSAYRHATSDVTGFTPFYLLYGRRERVPLPKYLLQDRPFNNRLDDLAVAYREAATRNLESRRYNRERLNKRANVSTSLQVGDSVVIKTEERVTNTSRWEPHWEVYRVRGPTHWLRNQRTGQTKTLNREKLTLVDPSIVWDDIPPRPKRHFKPRSASLRVQEQNQDIPLQIQNIPIANEAANDVAQQVGLGPDMPADQPMETEGSGQPSRPGTPQQRPPSQAQAAADDDAPPLPGGDIRDVRRGALIMRLKRKRGDTEFIPKWQRISSVSAY